MLRCKLQLFFYPPHDAFSKYTPFGGYEKNSFQLYNLENVQYFKDPSKIPFSYRFENRGS